MASEHGLSVLAGLWRVLKFLKSFKKLFVAHLNTHVHGGSLQQDTAVVIKHNSSLVLMDKINYI